MTIDYADYFYQPLEGVVIAKRRGLANPYHEPAGSSKGGEFAPAPFGEVSIIKKAKAPPATKEQIEVAVKMKAQGASYAEIQTETGLNPKQAATIIFKHKQALAEAKEKLTQLKKEDPFAVFDKPKIELKPEVPGSPISGDTPLGLKPTAELASKFEADLKAKGYEWKEKTTGPAKGKYAFFKNGIQVSANAPNDPEGMAKAVSTINFGKGPDYVAPPPPPTPGKIGGLIAEKVDKHDAPADWPIGDDVTRKEGSKYIKTIQDAGHQWSSKLTYDERDAVKYYTGSGSSSINSALRSGKSLSPKAKLIDSALSKASPPPPPELVWRGVPSVSQHALIGSLESGDVIRLAGFQSTSVNPQTATSWSSGQTLFEIKPTKGAYVGSISSHTSEREYILPHGAHYKVRGATMVQIGAVKRQVIQLEMLP